MAKHPSIFKFEGPAGRRIILQVRQWIQKPVKKEERPESACAGDRRSESYAHTQQILHVPHRRQSCFVEALKACKARSSMEERKLNQELCVIHKMAELSAKPDNREH